MSDITITGSCLCARVRFRYTGPLGGVLGAVTVCHCVQCRKAQGYAAGVVPAQAAGFAIIQGADLIREFESSPGKLRAFCGTCGSPLYSRLEHKPDVVRLRLGTLDNPPDSLKVEAHIYTAHVPAWVEPHDAPRYLGAEPGRMG